MAFRGKKYKKIVEKRPTEELNLADAAHKVKSLSYSTFPGSIELHLAMKLPKDKEAKSIKGSISLPHSDSEQKAVKIAVFTTPENDKAAKEAGADFVGMEELSKAVKAGKIEFDVAIATPAVMPKIAALGRELGPKGLMPNPKTGTVTDDIAKAIEEYRKGKQTFAADDTGVVHIKVGTIKTEDKNLVENIRAAVQNVADVVGVSVSALIKTVHLAPTMGPSIKVKYEVNPTV